MKFEQFELERNQSLFENEVDFYLSESKSKSMRLLGNSVAVDAVYHVGRNLIDYLENKEKFVFEHLFEPMLPKSA